MSKIGKIDISALTTPPEKHELTTAKFFSERGKDITFVKPSNIKGNHQPDFLMDGKTWEVKSPLGKSRRTIENNLRKAALQSPYIILDLRRIKISDMEQCINKIKRQSNSKKIKNLFVITQDGELLDIK